MRKLKMGTPAMGIAIGLGLVGVAVLIMLIGFWKTLLLVALFGIGFFLGTVENKQEFIKDTANKIIPEKEAKVFLTKEQWKAAFGLFGMYVGFALMFWLFGFIIAVPISLFIITFMLSKLSVKDATVKHRLIISLIYGVVGGAVLYLAYVVGLKTQMPTGLLFELLKK